METLEMSLKIRIQELEQENAKLAFERADLKQRALSYLNECGFADKELTIAYVNYKELKEILEQPSSRKLDQDKLENTSAYMNVVEETILREKASLKEAK